MFLSSYENKIDKKGRVSGQQRLDHFGSMGYNGFVSYPSFNHPALEACSQDRIENSLIPSILKSFEEKEIFATLYYQRVKTYSLILKEEFLYQKITSSRKIKDNVLLVLEKLFKSGNQKFLKI